MERHHAAVFMCVLLAVISASAKISQTSSINALDTAVFTATSNDSVTQTTTHAPLVLTCECTADTVDCSSLGLSEHDPAVHACPWPVSRVILRHNALRELRPLPASVVEVDVAWNALTQLPRSTQLSKNTRTLDASWNGAGCAGDELHDLSQLEELRINGNRLASLAFLPELCDALRVLRATDNAIWRVDECLGRCAALRELDLSGNPLSSIPAATFAPLVHLEELRLARCRLGLLPEAALNHLPRLRILDLSDNHLLTPAWPALAPLAPQLEHLDLAGNRLRALRSKNGTAMRFSRLERLRLARNALVHLDAATLAAAPRLESLDLGDNRLRQLPPGVFDHVTGLRHLVLSRNPLPAAVLLQLASLKDLETLQLDGCALRTLPAGALSANTRLRSLSACCNGMEVMEEGALPASAPALRFLSLRNNSLRALPPRLGLARDSLPALRHLDVADNRLEALPATLLGAAFSLHVLDASKNSLRELPALDPCCAPPHTTLLRDNALGPPDSPTLRTWLRSTLRRDDGAVVDLRGAQQRLNTVSLRAALEALNATLDPVEVFAQPDGSGDCACGGVRSGGGGGGGGAVLFCVDTLCYDSHDWTVALDDPVGVSTPT